jgi:hypothetical protein
MMADPSPPDCSPPLLFPHPVHPPSLPTLTSHPYRPFSPLSPCSPPSGSGLCSFAGYHPPNRRPRPPRQIRVVAMHWLALLGSSSLPLVFSALSVFAGVCLPVLFRSCPREIPRDREADSGSAGAFEPRLCSLSLSCLLFSLSALSPAERAPGFLFSPLLLLSLPLAPSSCFSLSSSTFLIPIPPTFSTYCIPHYNGQSAPITTVLLYLGLKRPPLFCLRAAASPHCNGQGRLASRASLARRRGASGKLARLASWRCALGTGHTRSV